MLDANLKQQLDAYLQNIVTPIELLVSSDDSPKAKEIEELAGEIASLNDKISNTTGDNRRTPSLAIAKAGEAPRVHFEGSASYIRNKKAKLCNKTTHLFLVWSARHRGHLAAP